MIYFKNTFKINL